MMIYAIASLRAALFGISVVTYFAMAAPLYPLYLISPNRMRKVLIKLIHFYSNMMTSYMGIKVSVKGLSDKEDDQNYLIISNHLSYLDILVICRIFPSAFVTSVEMRDTPFLGHICKLGGCLFVERRSRTNLSEEIKDITNGLKERMNVVIFPEATSSDGSQVLRFKRPLFQAAIDSQRPVLPLCLNYRYVSHEPITHKNRDSVFWYGDMTFIDHLWKVFKCDSIEVELTVHEPIIDLENYDPTLLAQHGHEIVSHSFKPILA